MLDDGFYNARTARDIASGSAGAAGLVLQEINAIRSAIDTAAVAGALSCEIVNTTAMTQGLTYFEAWSDPYNNQDEDHRVARQRMDRVIQYFSRLGYAIRRVREGVENRLSWEIKW